MVGDTTPDSLVLRICKEELCWNVVSSALAQIVPELLCNLYMDPRSGLVQFQSSGGPKNRCGLHICNFVSIFLLKSSKETIAV